MQLTFDDLFAEKNKSKDKKLKFQAMGCECKCAEIDNHRIRTVFKNLDGKCYFIELCLLREKDEWLIYFDTAARVDIIKNSFYDWFYCPDYEKFPANAERLLRHINSTYNCDFASIEIERGSNFICLPDDRGHYCLGGNCFDDEKEHKLNIDIKPLDLSDEMRAKIEKQLIEKNEAYKLNILANCYAQTFFKHKDIYVCNIVGSDLKPDGNINYHAKYSFSFDLYSMRVTS